MAFLLHSTAVVALLACSGAATAQVRDPAQDGVQPVPAPVTATPPAQTDTTETEPAAAVQEGGPDIVVTGTLLRGIAPTGTNVIGVSRDAITTSGAASTNDVLARIPQISNQFNTLPTPSTDGALPINRPNIRNLGSSGGSTTLVLVNGFRVVGQGILQTSPDPSIIPPGILDRVDVIPDGGSSIYGSDAIGGVVNFITRRRFDGVEANARYGFGDSYRTVDANATAGRDWGSGSLLLSYAFAHHDAVFGRDRDYINGNQTARGGRDNRVLTCAPGNITAGGVTYALPGRTPGANYCDIARDNSIYPAETRHSVYASLTQELTAGLTFTMTGYYSQRRTQSAGGPNGTSTGLAPSVGTITATNPYFRTIAGETSQNVAFSFAGIAPERFGKSYAFLNSYGLTPGFDARLGGDFRLRASANVGRSLSQVDLYQINQSAVTAALAGTTTATALNPYDLSATNPAVLAGIFDYTNFSAAVQEIAEGRLIVDGTLLRLPGGGVRIAAGYEHHYEDITQQLTLGRAGAYSLNNRGFQDRSVNSVFGELFVPVFGCDNAVPGIRSLDLSASVRHDRYSDVGGTTNPKFGINYRPFDALKIRANWGTSFHAPSLADLGGAVDSRYQVIPVSPFRPAATPTCDRKPRIPGRPARMSPPPSCPA